MNSLIGRRLLSALVLFLCSVRLFAGEDEVRHAPPAAFGPAAVDSPDYRKYAPDREVDILHLALDVTPDFKQRTVSGKATLKFKPIAKPFQELKLDAVDLAVESLTATERILGYQVTDKQIIVTFEQPIPPDKEASVTITY